MKKSGYNTWKAAFKLFKIISLICVSLLYNPFSYSQSIEITGAVKDTQNAPVINANITLINAADKILYYSFSDNLGAFKFSLTDKAAEKQIAYIVVTAFGYEKQKQAIDTGKTKYIFVLNPIYKNMDEVKILGMQRVKKSGDTISYNVNAFAGKEDKSIGDVIAKIPGMSVSENGKIKYKDKEISNLFIQGDDLLESNYGIGSNTISKEMIKSIQVIERFQPVRALQNKAMTNDVALNLVLKDTNALKLSGQASAGAGISSLVRTEVAAILFNKKVKTLNVAKFNNSGESFVNDKPDDLLNDAAIDNPGIPEKYINNNRSLLAEANYLYNFKDTLQVKTSIEYASDRNVFNYDSYNKNYLTGDTVIYNEYQNVVRKPNIFSASITLEKNKQAMFLKNDMAVKFAKNRSYSFMDFNGSSLNQDFSSIGKDISNSFRWIPFTKSKNTYEISWKLNYRSIPQDLSINPGIDSVELNNGVAYNAVFQDVAKKLFKSEIMADYFIKSKDLLKKSFRVGLDDEFQQLNSNILLWQTDGSKNFYAGDKGNSIRWHRHRLYIASGYSINTEHLKFNLSLPVSFQQVFFRDKTYTSNGQSNRVVVNPNLWTSYFFNSRHSLNIQYATLSDFGTINDIYQGAILLNFKQLRSNSNEIMQTDRNKLSLYYSYSDAIKILNFSLGGEYIFNRMNSIYSTIYEGTMMKTVLLPYKNRASTLLYDAAFSKYLFSLKSKLETEFRYSNIHTDLLINNSFSPYINQNFSMRVTGGCNLFKYVISIYYSGVANWFEGRFKTQNLSYNAGNADKGIIYNHTYSLIISPKIPFNFIFQAQQQINVLKGLPGNKYFFADLKLRYKAGKHRTEFEAEVNNIFNIKEFGTFYLSTNQFYSSNYQLRGRMILIKVNFIF